jgi:hypothetical protein
MAVVIVHRQCFEEQNPVRFNGGAVFQSGYTFERIDPGVWYNPILPHGHWLEISLELVSYLP